ncbi:MAG: transaldolase [Phycisphaerales bacterium]|nr:MAG: transaldolase [Phycisphaerales bacterium]
MPNVIQKLSALGQSVWCDHLSRAALDSGELARMIRDGITGVTSNPTIFMKAITGGSEYDALFTRLLADDLPDQRIYEGLVLPDIRDAADALRPVYDRTGGADGFISLEVNPHLAHDTQGTVEEARRLFAEVDRPNLMIKVPATPEGIPAVQTLIGAGVNVNITLIFSIDVYRRVVDAYLAGLHRLAGAGGNVAAVASVASFFVSRLDTSVDRVLDGMIAAGGDRAKLEALKGRAAVANAVLAYDAFKDVFQRGDAFRTLAARGAQVQRPLWASTSTKNPAYPDTLYVDPLIGPHTVNTMPPNTIEATLDHGRAELTIEAGLPLARATVQTLSAAGVDLDAVTDALLADGVRLFADSYDQLIANLAVKRRGLAAAGR